MTVLNGVAGAPVERKEVKEDKADDVPVERKGLDVLYDDGFGSVTVNDYFAAAKAVSRDDGGPPRWFCPVECGRPAVDDAPLLLFLPGACSWRSSTSLMSWPNQIIVAAFAQLALFVWAQIILPKSSQ